MDYEKGDREREEEAWDYQLKKQEREEKWKWTTSPFSLSLSLFIPHFLWIIFFLSFRLSFAGCSSGKLWENREVWGEVMLKDEKAKKTKNKFFTPVLSLSSSLSLLFQLINNSEENKRKVVREKEKLWWWFAVLYCGIKGIKMSGGKESHWEGVNGLEWMKGGDREREEEKRVDHHKIEEEERKKEKSLSLSSLKQFIFNALS